MRNQPDQLSDRLLNFAVEVIRIVDALPKTLTGRHIGGQLIRAGTSCGSNCEEACGAESRSDFAHKMSIVLKELKETRFWFRLIRRTKILDPICTNPVLDECEQLCAMVAKSIITAKGKK